MNEVDDTSLQRGMIKLSNDTTFMCDDDATREKQNKKIQKL